MNTNIIFKKSKNTDIHYLRISAYIRDDSAQLLLQHFKHYFGKIFTYPDMLPLYLLFKIHPEKNTIEKHIGRKVTFKITHLVHSENLQTQIAVVSLSRNMTPYKVPHIIASTAREPNISIGDQIINSNPDDTFVNMKYIQLDNPLKVHATIGVLIQHIPMKKSMKPPQTVYHQPRLSDNLNPPDPMTLPEYIPANYKIKKIKNRPSKIQPMKINKKKIQKIIKRQISEESVYEENEESSMDYITKSSSKPCKMEDINLMNMPIVTDFNSYDDTKYVEPVYKPISKESKKIAKYNKRHYEYHKDDYKNSTSKRLTKFDKTPLDYDSDEIISVTIPSKKVITLKKGDKYKGCKIEQGPRGGLYYFDENGVKKYPPKTRNK